MRFILTAIILLLSPASVFADIVDFECKLKRQGDQYNKFLVDSKNDKTSDAATLLKPPKETKKWWQFWLKNYDDIEYFSIDIGNKKILSTSYPVIIDISPNKIIIHEYVNCSSTEVSSCKDWRFQYNIDRITGDIDGFRKAPDNSWSPYFKYGDIIYSFSGYCEPVRRKF